MCCEVVLHGSCTPTASDVVSGSCPRYSLHASSTSGPAPEPWEAREALQGENRRGGAAKRDMLVKVCRIRPNSFTLALRQVVRAPVTARHQIHLSRILVVPFLGVPVTPSAPVAPSRALGPTQAPASSPPLHTHTPTCAAAR